MAVCGTKLWEMLECLRHHLRNDGSFDDMAKLIELCLPNVDGDVSVWFPPF